MRGPHPAARERRGTLFELGGHSLLALQVAAAVEHRTGWRMDPRALFFQNLRTLAASSAVATHR
ncbi:MAG: acyl carrier protein [Vicinamibacterales bacterium]